MLTVTLFVGSVCVIFSLSSFIFMINESFQNKCNNGALKTSISALEFGSSLAAVLGLALSFFCCRSFERGPQDLGIGAEALGIAPVIRASEEREPIREEQAPGDLVMAGDPLLAYFSPQGIAQLVEELEGMPSRTVAAARMLSLFPRMLLHFNPDADVSAIRGIIFSTVVVDRRGGSAGTNSALGTPARGVGELSE